MKVLLVGGDESRFVEIGSRRVSGGGWLEEGMEECGGRCGGVWEDCYLI